MLSSPGGAASPPSAPPAPNDQGSTLPPPRPDRSSSSPRPRRPRRPRLRRPRPPWNGENAGKKGKIQIRESGWCAFCVARALISVPPPLVSSANFPLFQKEMPPPLEGDVFRVHPHCESAQRTGHQGRSEGDNSKVQALLLIFVASLSLCGRAPLRPTALRPIRKPTNQPTMSTAHAKREEHSRRTFFSFFESVKWLKVTGGQSPLANLATHHAVSCFHACSGFKEVQ